MIVKVTNVLSWRNVSHEPPYTKWPSAWFHNAGPSGVIVGINIPDDHRMLEPEATMVVREQIDTIFFRCYPGLNSTVEVRGL